MTTSELMSAIELQRDLMVSVSTGGPRIQAVNAEYVARRSFIRRGLDDRSIDDPNPFSDLWGWHGRWSSGALPSWASRRVFVAQLYQPILDRLGREQNAVVAVEPTGWARVDRTLLHARDTLQAASQQEQFQTVGLLCREVLISAAQEVYDPTAHVSSDGVVPSSTDAKRMLEAFCLHRLPGESNQSIRKFVRASLDLANELQHRRTAEYRDAALCIEATVAVINVIAVLAGIRNREI